MVSRSWVAVQSCTFELLGKPLSPSGWPCSQILICGMLWTKGFANECEHLSFLKTGEGPWSFRSAKIIAEQTIQSEWWTRAGHSDAYVTAGVLFSSVENSWLLRKARDNTNYWILIIQTLNYHTLVITLKWLSVALLLLEHTAHVPRC